MKLRDQYDWIVLGDHPGALLSAGLAGRLGLSVLVLGLSPGARHRVSDGGQHLDPETNLVLGLGKTAHADGLVQECLRKLGILSPELDLIQNSDPLPQVATPDFRMRLTQEDEELEREILREFGRRQAEALGLRPALKESAAEFQAYWLGLPERLTLQAGPKKKPVVSPMRLEELKRKLERSGKGVRTTGFSWLSDSSRASLVSEKVGRSGFREVCSALWYGTTLSESDDPALGRILHAVALARTGASFRGGLTAYRDFLIRLAQRHGAHVPAKGECRRIFVENGRFVGVQVSQKGSMISAGGGVLGCALAHASERISTEGRGWLRRLKQSPAPSGWRFTLAVTVGCEAIPPGLSRRLVWKEPGAPVLEAELADPAEYGANEQGVRLLFARTVLPFSQESLSLEYQRMVAARMMKQLSELIPFLEFHVKKVYPDFRKSPDDGSRAELSEAYGFAMPEMIPENLRCFEAESSGVGSRSGVDGLFVATGESFPALGSLGPTVASLEAVSWGAHRAGLAGPLV